jgi:hypothetical protein
MITQIENECNGSGPHTGTEVRKYPLGGAGNLHLCFACWVRENKFNYERGRETKCPENFPQRNWFTATKINEEE